MEHHAYIPQSTVLKDFVRLFWQIERSNTDVAKEVIIPKGTIEIIFNLHEPSPFDACIGGQPYTIPRCFLSGFHTAPIQLFLPDKQVFFGVSFKLADLRKIFNVSAAEFANRCVDMTVADASIRSLWHQLAGPKTFTERVHIFAAWLAARLPDTSPQEQMLERFLNSAVNPSSVTELSKQLYYSPRQLSRKLYQLTGMNSEQTLLYKRYLHSITLIHQSSLSLTQIAYQCGFADQSHFIKTFRSFAQMKPGEYKNVKSGIHGHIFSNVR